MKGKSGKTIPFTIGVKWYSDTYNYKGNSTIYMIIFYRQISQRLQKVGKISHAHALQSLSCWNFCNSMQCQSKKRMNRL